MKCDCNKTLDCMHDLNRVCDRYAACSDGCPFLGRNCIAKTITQTEIDILQKWSDENPEAPKLTKKDRAFLECFEAIGGKSINKSHRGSVFYNYGDVSSMLTDDMFKVLEPDTRMTFEELLKLEVEE